MRLIDIANSAPNVGLVCYVLTRDFNEFAAVREDLLLRTIDYPQPDSAPRNPKQNRDGGR